MAEYLKVGKEMGLDKVTVGDSLTSGLDSAEASLRSNEINSILEKIVTDLNSKAKESAGKGGLKSFYGGLGEHGDSNVEKMVQENNEKIAQMIYDFKAGGEENFDGLIQSLYSIVAPKKEQLKGDEGLIAQISHRNSQLSEL